MNRPRHIPARSLLLGLAALGTAAAHPAADLVVLNGDVLTLDEAFSHVNAVAIKDGRFVATGSDDDMRSWIGPATRTIDVRGAMVIPGLNESHVHATGAARSEVRQPFRQLTSIGDIQGWVRAKAAATPAGDWIELPRVDITRIRERRIPNRAELDVAAPGHPTVFTWQYANRVVQILNTAALRAAGITAETVAPKGGRIELDADGQPTGRLDDSDDLLDPFTRSAPVGDEDYLKSLARLLRDYNATGITSINERYSNPEGYDAYRKLEATGQLPVRVTVTIGLRSDGSVADTERKIKALPFKFRDGDDWVRVGPLKIGVDGGVLYGTAYMREPYPAAALEFYGLPDKDYHGTLRISRDKIANIIRTGHRLGWQMASHVTGDAGVDAVLDGVEAANADSPIAPMRYNLIHAYFPTPETARRAARLGVCVDTQPALYCKDGDALSDAWGADRFRHFMGVGAWRRHGAHVIINSDHMKGFDPETSLNPYNPFLTLQIAVARKTEGGQVLGPEDRVSREDALRMMTTEAAWMSFDEKAKGSIEVGKLADLAILTGDYLRCPEDEIHDLRAALTIVGGRIVYDSATTQQ